MAGCDNESDEHISSHNRYDCRGGLTTFPASIGPEPASTFPQNRRQSLVRIHPSLVREGDDAARDYQWRPRLHVSRY